MTMVAQYLEARRDEDVARLRRAVALRAMRASGASQAAIAAALGVSQPAVSQQLRSAEAVRDAHPDVLIEAAAPVLKRLAEERGFSKLAVFGSAARREARSDSDIDLLIAPPTDASSFDLVSLQQLFRQVVGREVDLLTYASLVPGIDDDIAADVVVL